MDDRDRRRLGLGGVEAQLGQHAGQVQTVPRFESHQGGPQRSGVRMGHLVDEHLGHQRPRCPRGWGGARGRASFPLDPLQDRVDPGLGLGAQWSRQ